MLAKEDIEIVEGATSELNIAASEFIWTGAVTGSADSERIKNAIIYH